ncbi:MAG: D-alanyl-D-alanine carboxypeptidase [Devosiaceae bacterium]|nr:D-alanyl-D-alanine carboxypeptidase [Devosiaceae bacterium]
MKRAYAGIVVDAKSGKTLYSRAADAQRYPASVTKVMTLYVLFQELDAGRLKLSTRMRVSKFASNAVPSKLGLRAGSTISVENAIKALVTKSANDVARVIAEHISGTETKFAQRMTKVARSLGMKRTTYRNASGLPNSKQITTVRDQSRLGIAIYQHFPKYYKYFQTRLFKYKGKRYGNNNRLLGQNGIDGIKTGYIRASGFNLLTASRKDNRHIIVVAFGFDSGTQRNAKVAALVNSYLKKARRGSYVAQARIAKPRITGITRVAARPVTPMPRIIRLADSTQPLQIASTAPINIANQPSANNTLTTSPIPATRPVNLLVANVGSDRVNLASRPMNLAVINPTPATNLLASSSQDKPIDIIGEWISDRIALEDNNGTMILPPVGIGSGTQTIDLLTSGSVTKNAIKPIEKPKEIIGWKVQIGTSNSEESAQLLIADASKTYSPLKNLRPTIEQLQKNGVPYYRARFVGFANIEQAQSACKKLKQKEISCLAVLG